MSELTGFEIQYLATLGTLTAALMLVLLAAIEMR